MVDEMGREVEGEEGNAGSDLEAPVYKIGEAEYSADDLPEELKVALKDSANKANWQKEYTQRDMTLAESRKGVERAMQVEKFFQEHPDLYSEFEGMVKKRAVPADGSANPDFSKFQQELSGIKETLAVKDAEAEISRELGELKSTYKDYFAEDPKLEAAVVKHAYDRQLPSMQDAFKSYMFDTIQGKKLNEGIRRGQEAMKKSRGLAQPSASSAGVRGPNLKGTWNDIGKQITDKYDLTSGE